MALICVKCNGRMEEGFVVDHSHTAMMVATWVSGPPEKSMFRGLSLAGKQQIPLCTFRCTSCGYTEAYAK
jgi:hypothetical protein